MSFEDIFDLGYGSSICKFLEQRDVVSMHQVSKNCSKTIVKYIEKYNLLNVSNDEYIIIKNRNRIDDKYYKPHKIKLPIIGCNFRYANLGGLGYFVIFYNKTHSYDPEYGRTYTIYDMKYEEWYILHIILSEYLKKKAQIKIKKILHEQNIIAQNQAAFMAYTCKPKLWSNFKNKIEH